MYIIINAYRNEVRNKVRSQQCTSVDRMFSNKCCINLTYIHEDMLMCSRDLKNLFMVDQEHEQDTISGANMLS